jgi:hypothetical protein
MKDFYDIWYLANTFDFDGRKLQEAIYETFQNRGTVYEANSFSNIMAFDKDRDMKMKWKEFIRRLKLPELEFSDVLRMMDSFLSPAWDAIINEDECLLSWDAKNNSWN